MKPTAGLPIFIWVLLLATPVFATDGPDAVQDLVFLGDRRPIFLRLRISLGPQAFRVAWLESVQVMHRLLDRDGDGTLSPAEADRKTLATLVRASGGEASALPRGAFDLHPPDGVVSVAELADALRTALGPFRIQPGPVTSGRDEALFDRLDGDGDGQLDRAELAGAAATLHRFDLDDDELIDGAELDPFTVPGDQLRATTLSQRDRATAALPVVELRPGDASLRPVRQLLAKYDKEISPGALPGENKLTRAEFAIDPEAFARADADHDGALDTEELRRFLPGVGPDVELAVTLSADGAGAATVAVARGGSAPWVQVKVLGPADVEIAADEVRLEVHVEDGGADLAAAQRTAAAQFAAADTNANGSVEKSELNVPNRPSPLAGLFDLLDRDGDAKLDPHERDKFVTRQSLVARNRLILTTTDQGRAIFAILDLNRDRRLGNREIRAATARLSTWDWNHDDRVTPDEIPHHFRLALGRGSLAGISRPTPNSSYAVPDPVAPPIMSGPSWFRRMDRNHDGDVSRREFRGPRAQFDRLDRDGDGLLDPTEAEAATPAGQ